ncbi:hypothetical protein [Nannocystis punicea]|uniref:Uncharacterized protein n=1 Tax=Nannocystis punicea TaxID=2995304 RepID=A0ABY7H0P5_9BACT|nr:hypothetical protein [Nannocystis poenicansa]WAS92821.1 hypothetical protein O0S08_42155 [Nannocystis poenicansa]
MPRTTVVASLFLASVAALAACSKHSDVARLNAPDAAGYTPAEAPQFQITASTADAAGPMAPGGGEASVSGEVAERERSRGLGTAYGEQRSSSVRGTQFQRADAYNPDLVLSMRYNDAAGVQQIAQHKTGSPYILPASQQNGPVSLTLRDEYGAPLSAAQVGGDVYAIGEIGARYSIGVENHTAQRLEVVASVDGLDVLDGGEADFHKRGYVVAPYTSFAIEGWRTSDDTVAAFRFSDTDSGYAAQTGKPRNIGVIGVAFFREAGHDDLFRRDTADPFPNRYAPPPPSHRGY